MQATRKPNENKWRDETMYQGHDEHKFTTRDMMLAATFITKGHKLTGTERDGRVTFFVFTSENGELRRLADDYFDEREMPISPRRYAQNWKALRTLL
jgi:hypothetical protein